MGFPFRNWFFAVATVLSLTAATVSAQQKQRRPTDMWGLTIYETRYYIMHTDLGDDDAREAAVRMTRMAEEYHAITSGFSGDIRQKLPFYLFKNGDDYYKAGGLPGSAGVFDGKELMAIAGDHPDANTWHTVQHEGFPQFAHAVIGGQMPPWLNEGMAEYFGEAVFTGDGFVPGVIPPMRLRRVRAEISSTQDWGFKSIPDLMTLSQEQWNMRLTTANYDQGWSVVHFLAQGDNGKYQPTLNSFMQLIGRNVEWQRAWMSTFGPVGDFEKRWRDYWKNLPDNPTLNLYVQANVATLTSFLARCNEQKQTFDGFTEYLAAINAHSLKISDSDWLPGSLIDHAAEFCGRIQEEGAKYSLKAKPLQVICVLPDGTRFIGHYSLEGGHVASVNVDVYPPKKTTTKPTR